MIRRDKHHNEGSKNERELPPSMYVCIGIYCPFWRRVALTLPSCREQKKNERVGNWGDDRLEDLNRLNNRDGSSLAINSPPYVAADRGCGTCNLGQLYPMSGSRVLHPIMTHGFCTR